MGFIQWLRGVEPQDVRHTDTDPSAYPIEYQLDAVRWHTHNGAISPLAVPAVYAAIDLISASIAQLETQPATPLSLNPDNMTTRYDFFFETVHSLAWHGDAYWLHTPTERGIETLQVLDPVDVDVEWDDRFARRVRQYRWKTQPISSLRISHLRFHPRAGETNGLSPIEAARLTWEGAAYSESWGSNLFSASGVPSGVLKFPTVLTGDEAAEFRREWDAARLGSRSTAVLSGGMEYEPVELSPSDIGWLDTRSSNAQEVARIFHIPSDMLEVAIQGGASSITYRNLSEISADFIRWCLQPYLEIIQDAWVRLAGQPRITFDTTPLYEESLEARSRTLQMLVATGVDPAAAAKECGFDFTVTAPVKEVPVGTPAI